MARQGFPYASGKCPPTFEVCPIGWIKGYLIRKLKVFCTMYTAGLRLRETQTSPLPFIRAI